MLLIHYTKTGLRRITDLSDVLQSQTVILMGGAPSIKEQPLELLTQRGVITMAMNNAAIHFKPTLWSSGDNPACYEPQILMDPTITKFAPITFADNKLNNGMKYNQVANIYFYTQKDGVPWYNFFENKNYVPWYNNTLFVSIHLLYQLGVRRIILGGSDFGFTNNNIYAHETKLGTLEQKWNMDLYNGLAKEVRSLKPIFETAGLTLLDCSKNSRISQVYKHITMEEAVKLCLEKFPATMMNPADLPHCSKFAPDNIKEKIAKWPGNVGEYSDNLRLANKANDDMQRLI